MASLLDKDSRTVAARIVVKNKDARLKPEMFATATIETSKTNDPTREAFTVPDAAIVLMQGQPALSTSLRENEFTLSTSTWINPASTELKRN